MPLPPFRPRRRAPGPRGWTLLPALVACCLVVLAAAVPAQPSDAGARTPGALEADQAGTPTVGGRLLRADTDPAGGTDGDGEDDRELVPGLVAVVLLAMAIGLHALHRDGA